MNKNILASHGVIGYRKADGLIYEDGTENLTLVQGSNDEGTMTLDTSNIFLEAVGQSTGIYKASVFTQDKINFTNIKRIIVEWESDDIDGTNTTQYNGILLGNDTTNSNNEHSYSYAPASEFTRRFDVQDVSTVTGSYHLGFLVSIRDIAHTVQMKIYKIYLVY